MDDALNVLVDAGSTRTIASVVWTARSECTGSVPVTCVMKVLTSVGGRHRGCVAIMHVVAPRESVLVSGCDVQVREGRTQLLKASSADATLLLSM